MCCIRLVPVAGTPTTKLACKQPISTSMAIAAQRRKAHSNPSFLSVHSSGEMKTATQNKHGNVHDTIDCLAASKAEAESSGSDGHVLGSAHGLSRMADVRQAHLSGHGILWPASWQVGQEVQPLLLIALVGLTRLQMPLPMTMTLCLTHFTHFNDFTSLTSLTLLTLGKLAKLLPMISA